LSYFVTLINCLPIKQRLPAKTPAQFKYVPLASVESGPYKLWAGFRRAMPGVTPIYPFKQAKSHQVKEFKISTDTAVTFRSGGYLLNSTLHLPDVPRPAVVIGSHGLFGTAASAKQTALAAACLGAGIGYLRFDHRGCGGSEGDFEKVTTLEGRVQDLLAAAAMIRRRSDTGDRFGYFGSSLGGAVCIRACGKKPPDAMVLCAAPVRSGDIDPDRAAATNGSAGPALRPAGLTFDVAVEAAALQEILIFHGDADEVVTYRHAGEIYDAAAGPKEMITLPGGDHRMTLAEHQQLFVTETIRWFQDRLAATDGS